MRIVYYHINTFISPQHLGNPAGVCLLPKALNTNKLQFIANQLALPETAFIWKNEHKKWQIRWFSPQREVMLCGHGTLAAAYALSLSTHKLSSTLDFTDYFYTERFKLGVTQNNETRFTISFPAKSLLPARLSQKALAILGITMQDIEAVYCEDALYIVLSSENLLRTLSLNISALIDEIKSAVVITTRKSVNKNNQLHQTDFLSRHFTLDKTEDAVTGATHCALVPYWGERLKKSTLIAEQISKRGGILQCHWNKELNIIDLSGELSCFLKGHIITI